MTGPEHYLEAERLMDVMYGKDRSEYPDAESITAEAQVHAILALAAATAVNSPADTRAWIDAAGTKLSGT